MKSILSVVVAISALFVAHESFAVPVEGGTDSDKVYASAFQSSGLVEDLPFLDSPPPKCPPPEFQEKKNLNISAYIARRWYVQEQQPVSYLDSSTNFCVTAKYLLDGAQNEKIPKWNWLKPLLNWLRYVPGEQAIKVFNYANKGRVNGEPMTGNLSAVVLRPEEFPGQLMVGPSFLPRVFWGPYWVVAAGPGPDRYSWAIVSGGPPSQRTSSGYCKTGDGTNDSGFWLFTESQTVSADRLQYLRTIAKGLGFDLSVLKPVTQAGCNYSQLQEV